MIRFARLAVAACGLLLASGCGSLPDTRFLSERYTKQAARFSSAMGPLSEKRSAAIAAQLKRGDGKPDLLDRQLALEEAISGSPLVVGNKVTLLEDGPATHAAMLAAIAKATDHVNIETYIVEDDEVGRRLADALVERQGKGVQVNFIYDSFGAIGTPRAYFDRLRDAGVRVLEFNPLNPLVLVRPWTIDHRDHRKLLVADGRVAILGGINISSVYSAGSSSRGTAEVDPKSGWRDTDVQVEGPVVAEFQKLFLDTWARQKAEPPAPRNYFPALAPRGKDIVRALGSTPEDEVNRLYLTLIAAITNAQEQVYLTNAYFVPDPQLLDALLAAAARGVDVRLLLPSRSDSDVVFHAGRSYYAQLLEGGVKIYERLGALLHAKTALIDGVWSCVGSSNLDWRSALDNDEIAAVVVGREFGGQMLAAFNRDLAASRQILLHDWRRRSLRLRVNEFTARLWGRLL